MALVDAIVSLGGLPYTLTRTVRGTYTKGVLVPGATGTLAIVALVHPVEGRDLERLPEGRTASEALVVYTTTPLLIGGTGSVVDADRISINGKSWEVEHVETWPSVGLFYRAVVREIGPDVAPPAPFVPGTYEAGEDLLALSPVYRAVDGKLYKVGNTEEKVAAMLGFAKSAATAGTLVDVWLPVQVVPGFGALPLGTELWLLPSASPPVALHSALPGATWTRPVGVALTADSLVYMPGDVATTP